MGCLRFLLFQVWKLALAALFAMLLARIDDYVENRYGDRAAGKAWRAYRRRGKKGGEPTV
jgi:protein-S-isoprenylcysteine O-methyltransferase Ste14